jgi:hypothetical protein
VRSPFLFFLLALALGSAAQEKPSTPPPEEKKPQVKVNYINVCNPAEPDSKEIAAALERIPLKPAFAVDFEQSRGRSSMADAPATLAEAGLPGAVVNDQGISRWVRVRREFARSSPFLNVQYSISLDEAQGSTTLFEVMVFRVREPRDVLQISIQDKITAAGDPLLALVTDTPADRIKIERFGKSSLGLARCAEADQKSYDPIFAKASSIAARYRAALGVRESVPGDLRRLGIGAPQKSVPRKAPATKPAAGAESRKSGAAKGPGL